MGSQSSIFTSRQVPPVSSPSGLVPPHVLPFGGIEGVVRAVRLELTQALLPYGFSYHFGFRRRPTQDVRGLDYTFTLASPL